MCPVNLSEIWEWEGPAQGGRYELQLLRDLDMLGADSPWTLDQISVSGQNLTFIINYLWRSPAWCPARSWSDLIVLTRCWMTNILLLKCSNLTRLGSPVSENQHGQLTTLYLREVSPALGRNTEPETQQTTQPAEIFWAQLNVEMLADTFD